MFRKTQKPIFSLEVYSYKDMPTTGSNSTVYVEYESGSVYTYECKEKVYKDSGILIPPHFINRRILLGILKLFKIRKRRKDANK